MPLVAMSLPAAGDSKQENEISFLTTSHDIHISYHMEIRYSYYTHELWE